MDLYSKNNLLEIFKKITTHPLTKKTKKLPIGLDGVSSLSFQKNLHNNLIEIERKIYHKDYNYSSLLAVEKNDQLKSRTLYIPRIRDQIVFKLVHEDIINSARRNCINLKIPAPSSVLKDFQNKISKINNPIILRTDITNFYSSIPRNDVIEKAIKLTTNPKTIFLLHQFKNILARKARSIYSNSDFIVKGLPEGVSLSSSLSELWGKEIDVFLSKYTFFRYVDDILIIAKNNNDANFIKKDLSDYLSNINLSLSDKKTKIVNCKDGFYWLGLKHFNNKTIVDNNKVEKWFRFFLNKRKYFSNQISYEKDLTQKSILSLRFIQEINDEIDGRTSSRIFWYSNADNIELWKEFDRRLHSLIKSIIRQSGLNYKGDYPSTYRKIKMIKNRTPKS